MTSTTSTKTADKRRSDLVHVHIVGGFLGSGKTTLLERLLAYEVARGERPGVVENELGEADVDGRVLHEGHAHEGASIEVIGLTGGCVCCDQSAALGELVAKMARARKRTSIFVETTGLASLRQTVDALAPALAELPGVSLGRVIGLVDATRIDDVVATWPAAGEHLRPADVVLVNKTDIASTAQTKRAVALAKRLAPKSAIHLTSFAEIDPAKVLGGAGGATRLPIRRSRGPIVDSTRGFTTSSFFVTRPVDLERLEALVRRHPKSLVRLKGLVAVPNDDRPHEIQWTGTTFDAKPFTSDVGRPYLVAIGRRLRWDDFLDGLADCLVRVLPRSKSSARRRAR